MSPLWHSRFRNVKKGLTSNWMPPSWIKSHIKSLKESLLATRGFTSMTPFQEIGVNNSSLKKGLFKPNFPRANFQNCKSICQFHASFKRNWIWNVWFLCFSMNTHRNSTRYVHRQVYLIFHLYIALKQLFTYSKSLQIVQ